MATSGTIKSSNATGFTNCPTQKLISKGSLGWFFDITNIPQYSDESCYLASSNHSLNASTKYDNSYTTYTGKALTNEHMVINWFKSKKNPEFERLLATTSRNVVDNDVVALILGDSITYAASNAGLQNAWRKYISTKLNLYEIAHAVSGTTMTYGYAFDWNGKVNTDEAYDLEMTGVRGIKTLINTSLTQVVSGKSPQNHGFTLARTSIAIIALGTNDFGANAPLGSVNTLDDDGTFYGATYQLYHYLHDDLQIPIILFVAPFKREDWSVNNSAPVPYTIYDMAHALAEISLLETDMYVFDCTDRWYLNYDDTSIRAKSFIVASQADMLAEDWMFVE